MPDVSLVNIATRLVGGEMFDDNFITNFGSRPCDHYFCSVCWFVCLFFVCAEFFSAVFDPISIKLGHVLYVWV